MGAGKGTYIPPAMSLIILAPGISSCRGKGTPEIHLKSESPSTLSLKHRALSFFLRAYTRCTYPQMYTFLQYE